MVATKIVICITNRQEHRIRLVKHERMPDFQAESSCCNPSQHRAASGHLCTAPLQLKHCPNSSFWRAIEASGFCNLKQQRRKWIAETKLFHQDSRISEQHLISRNCLLRISTIGLGIPRHFHTMHREGVTWTQPQPLGACALLTESVLTQGYSRDSFSSDLALLCLSGLEFQWGSSSSAMHRQVGRTQVCSCSGPCCWGWQHGHEAACPEPLENGHLGMATPRLDVGVALAVSDDLSVSNCTRLYYIYVLIERLILQLQLTLIFTSPLLSEQKQRAIFSPTVTLRHAKAKQTQEIYYLRVPTLKISSMDCTSMGLVCCNKKEESSMSVSGFFANWNETSMHSANICLPTAQ